MKNVLITGASAGIGKAITEKFAQEGFGIILVARRKVELDKIADDLKSKYNVFTKVIVSDLSDSKSPTKIYQQLEKENIPVDILVNNAGYAIKETFSGANYISHEKMLQVMITSLVQLSHLFLPQMKERKYGKIVNIASVAAFLPPMTGSLYTGIKTFVLNFSIALDFETKPFGVDSIAVCPGLTYSEFHDSMGIQKEMNGTPRFIWQTSEKVAEETYKATIKGKTIIINGWPNKFAIFIMKFLPQKLKLYFARKTKSYDI